LLALISHSPFNFNPKELRPAAFVRGMSTKKLIKTNPFYKQKFFKKWPPSPWTLWNGPTCVFGLNLQAVVVTECNLIKSCNKIYNYREPTQIREENIKNYMFCSCYKLHNPKRTNLPAAPCILIHHLLR
jgi:hypothetical protein